MGEGKEAFEVVYEQYFSDVYNYVFGQILNREQTEDMVSEIFIKAMTHYDSFDPTRASVRTWLNRIARNTLIDSFRRGARTAGSVSMDDEDAGVEPSYEDEYNIFQEETEKEVAQLMSLLSQPERELLGMIYFENMKNEEIGAVLGINAKAVSERHRRLLIKCRHLVAKHKLLQ